MRDMPWIDHNVEDGLSVIYLTAISDSLRQLGLRARERCVLDGSRVRELDTAAGFTLFRHDSIRCTFFSVNGNRSFMPSRQGG